MIIYFEGNNFYSFWQKFLKHIKDFEYNYEQKDCIEEVDERNANLRHAKGILIMEGRNISIHFYAILVKKASTSTD